MLKNIARKTLTIDPEILRAFFALIILIFIGTAVYTNVEGWSILDSAYFSVITLTTIGYGDMHPTHDSTKLFTMGYALVGVGLVFYVFTSVTRHLFEDEKKEIQNIEHEIERLETMLRKRKKRS